MESVQFGFGQDWLLYISTSVWVLCTPNAGGNMCFNVFCAFWINIRLHTIIWYVFCWFVIGNLYLSRKTRKKLCFFGNKPATFPVTFLHLHENCDFSQTPHPSLPAHYHQYHSSWHISPGYFPRKLGLAKTKYVSPSWAIKQGLYFRRTAAAIG